MTAYIAFALNIILPISALIAYISMRMTAFRLLVFAYLALTIIEIFAGIT
jgi:hypothetical protein